MTEETMTQEGGKVAGLAPGEERLQLIPSGPDGYDKLLELIESAEDSLRCYYYTFASDECGRKVLDGLVAAANRGVSVSLIVDDFGSIETNDGFFDPLKEAGGAFCEFQPKLIEAYLLRNHQKMAIADEQRALIGSFNVGEEHMRTGGNRSWRDVGVFIEGPAAARLAGYYDQLEEWVRDENSRVRDLGRILADANETEGEVRWIFGGPARQESAYVQQVIDEFWNSDSVDMIMAYFAPSRRVLAAVRRVARQGRLRLIAARKTDVRLSRAAAWHTYRKLLRVGAEIYEYIPLPLHTKLIVTKNAVFIGSGNFDVRSLYVNLEIMLRVEREDFHDEICKYFAAELEDSERIDIAALKRESNSFTRTLWRGAYWMMTSADWFMSRRFAR